MAKSENLIKGLINIGAILGIVAAILCVNASDMVWGIIAPLIVIVLAVLLLMGEGVIPINKKIPVTWIIVLIFGIVFVIMLWGVWVIAPLGWVGGLGGILLIVAALLDKFMK